ncbi:DNA-methyltransferase [Sulfuracidifex metallicus]|uniref:Type II methyltransferase n=1 Tax=Sulfuracidifex metallicus DSM 6482 = JCM 9184 TaxID=523847 RepID=A0A6A9QJA3_SULME|nr:site-specific DNA-methyltransferase [Sulfuracidifex metallicus]MUN29076.1 site-specific DNA-methyltransferase [Sulfuracidifex metallicus DSM 6482 = JCM 9184]WOE50413.1 site-specific DNA-methyltransferase [Sulfuracidifex metallicus DSM 6482 = JCM 9184]
MIKVIFGDSRNMSEIVDESVGLVLTSPPYYNAPFDFPDLFPSYSAYLDLLKGVGKEVHRVLEKGRAAVFVTADVRIDGVLYPIVADLIKIMQDLGFKYQERIIWKKPEGYIRISRRSGVLIQHPYPLYFYPDNIYEDIVIFKKQGNFTPKNKEESKIDITKFQREKWYSNVWEITNVLPNNKLSKFTAPFPEDLARRIITLYSYVGDVVLDPFTGTGTTLKVAREMGRNAVGYEIDLELKDVIRERIPVSTLFGEEKVEFLEREDAKRLSSNMRAKINEKLENKKVS